ncbi:MAG: Asp-tRNA(Asn)/Glu-tRNA(Gln) amidotransferase subunit GatC [Burkholderiales bacterium]
MSLSPDQIERIARLARIAVSAAETEELRAQLNRVLALIDELQSIDTGGITPLSHALEALLPAGQRLRPDAVAEHDRRAEFQAIAPAVDGGLYLVPRVIE